MAYGIAQWEIEMLIQARNFIRDAAILLADESVTREARELCETISHSLNDGDWEFDEPPKAP